MKHSTTKTAYYHLPGLFEFYDLYSVFLPLFYSHFDMLRLGLFSVSFFISLCFGKIYMLSFAIFSYCKC